MSNGKVFCGGVPTDIDVRALREAYPESGLKTGQVIPYEAVARLAKCEVNSHRFRTVTMRWRRIVERESHFVIGTEPGKGFKVLDDHEKLDLAGAKLRSAVRFTRRSFHVAALTERKELTDEEQRRYDFVTARAAAVIASAQLRGRTDVPKMLR